VTACATAPLWQRPEMRAACGDTLRPGGLELTERAARLAGLAPGWRVLDAGAGLGATVEHLRRDFHARAVGLDRCRQQLGLPPADAPLVHGDVLALPFVDRSFDMVFCECVLSLIPDKARALGEMARVLAPGGWLALSDLTLAPAPEIACHIRCGSGASRAMGSESAARPRADAPPESCADGALPEAELLAEMVRAGLAVRRVEDHTKKLKELAARFILSGFTPGCRYRPGTGYALVLAQREEGTP